MFRLLIQETLHVDMLLSIWVHARGMKIRVHLLDAIVDIWLQARVVPVAVLYWHTSSALHRDPNLSGVFGISQRNLKVESSVAGGSMGFCCRSWGCCYFCWHSFVMFISAVVVMLLSLGALSMLGE